MVRATRLHANGGPTQSNMTKDVVGCSRFFLTRVRIVRRLLRLVWEKKSEVQFTFGMQQLIPWSRCGGCESASDNGD